MDHIKQILVAHPIRGDVSFDELGDSLWYTEMPGCEILKPDGIPGEVIKAVSSFLSSLYNARLTGGVYYSP